MKIKLRKLMPLIGIGLIAISGIATGTALALTAGTNTDNIAIYDKSLMSFALQNLISYDVLNNPEMLSDYLFDYGVFGNVPTNPYKEVKVNFDSDKNNGDSVYTITSFELVSVDNSITYNYNCNEQTNVKVVTEIDSIDFSKIIDLFAKFNTYNQAYQQCFSTSSNLINFVASNTNINSEFIDNVSINFSNDYNNTIANTLAFNLTITLKDKYTYNGSNVIFKKLESSILVDWKQAYNNANDYFNINSQGIITGITDEALKQEFLVIPMEYLDANYNTNPITGIQSLLPSDLNSLTASNIKGVILPNNIKVIGDNAFGNNANPETAYQNLTWINLPKSLQSIGNEAFANCTKLQSLDFASLNYLLTIGEYAFKNCDSFNYVIMSNSINNLGVGVFDNLDNLKSLKLSRSLSTIPGVAFGSSRNLKSLVIPYGITTIGNKAFAYSGTSTVNFPYSIIEVQEAAFTDTRCKNIVFLDRGVVNPIKFGSILFGGQGKNFGWNTSIYILGKYTTGSNFWLTFWNYSNFYLYVNTLETYRNIPGGGNNMRISDTYYLMSNNNAPFPTINNIDSFVTFVQNNVSTGEDILNIASNPSYVKNLASQFNMLENSNWIKGFEFYTNSINNYVSELNFKVILTNNLSFNINVPLNKSIYYPQEYLFNQYQQIVIPIEVIDELRNIVFNYFKEHANTYSSSNLSSILGGEQYVQELYDLMNNVLDRYTNDYIDIYIYKYNIWGGGGAWSNSNGYRNVDIAFGLHSQNNNSIYIPSNDLGVESGIYNSTKYIVVNNIETNIRS